MTEAADVASGNSLSLPIGTSPSGRERIGSKLDPLVREGIPLWGDAPELRTFPARGQLFCQGAAADEAYLLLKGRVQIVRDGALRRVSLESLSRGDWLGIGELLQKRSYNVTAIATEQCVVVVLGQETLERAITGIPSVLVRAVRGLSDQNQRYVRLLENQALEQTFLGLCKGLELVMGQREQIAESQLISQLRELFGIPTASLREAFNLLDGLNLLKKRQEAGKEAMISLRDPANFSERVRSFAEQWRGRLPSVLGSVPAREPYTLDQLCELLGLVPNHFLRRMTQADFPMGIVRFDPEGVELFRKTQGDSFFKRRVTGREMLSQVQSTDDLIALDLAQLREILPRMELSRLLRLMCGLREEIRNHLMQALSNRMRRMVEEELPHLSEVVGQEMADLEDEILRLCRSA